ncbi:TorF family putative porin [Pararhizobium mangrovi]|uniref:Porin n=1 Tax=Pararhizobium mangrovi TaxID=2590452 RepID=A0A506UA09_9HYPH|nr:TorF family putative porin [Pararhizobium mangrovi]TPW30710.1 hypothetical protein FJU11_04605 [Pararhizobium mangrovi]
MTLIVSHTVRRAAAIAAFSACLVGTAFSAASAQSQQDAKNQSTTEGANQAGQASDPLAYDPDKFDIKATFTGVTDYVSQRGFSQTDQDPALQGTLDVFYGDFHSGFFISNVDFGAPEPDIEFDPYVAWRPTFGQFSVDVTAYSYLYLDAPQDDYPEVFATGSYKIQDLATVGATFALGPDYFGADDTGYFYRANLSVPLPHDFTFSGSFGYQAFANNTSTEHLVWDAGVSYKFNDNVSFSLSYHDTDIDHSKCTGIFQCGPTVVGAINVTTSLSELRKKFKDQ